MSNDGFHAGIDINAPGPVYRARLPRRPQPPVPSRWSTPPPSGCDTCDFIGPAETGLQGDLIEAHRAMHQFGRTLIDPLVPIVVRVNDMLTRKFG